MQPRGRLQQMVGQPGDGKSPFDRRGLSRRSLLKIAIGTVGAAITAGAGVPLIGYFVSPILKSKARREAVNLGPESMFQVMEPKQVNFTERVKDGWETKEVTRAVWVVKKGDGSFLVYNPHCTHLGCAYNWEPDKKRFVSPCHNGNFDIDGKVLSGPPPRPLDTLPWTVEKGSLNAVYIDFKIGVPQKAEL